MDDFKFKKKYGQNFLKDDRIVEKIVTLSDIEDDSLVIEVGPGKGILTRQLSKAAKSVICYEIDMQLEEYLINLSNELSNVEVVFSDFLDADLAKKVSDYKYKHLYFISNVPYYITTPILMKLINSGLNFLKIVMMVQEEVGERFSATPGKKAYSSITVFLNYYYEIKRLFKVNRSEFIPVPNVDSEVIMLTSREGKIALKNKDLFFEFVRSSFQYKRKNLRNNLKKYDLKKIEEVLVKYGYSLNSRAEEIPVSVFAEIANSLAD
ncbi:MAG: ribosomal RNA small subunit methyltransferase A [Clostridium sp.]|nr:ribosomal RNA small subunit methyltransferase A [Clostridium sp.]